MALISGSIPNVINGISQQPPSLRLPTQAEKQVNGFSSVVKGLFKRPPTQHIALINNFTTASFVHTMRLLNANNELELFFVVIASTGIKVYNSSGVEQTVTGSFTYLSSVTNPQEQLAATSVADYTFILNKTTKVKKGTATSAALKHEGLIFVKQGDYSSDYKATITYNGVEYSATYTTRDSSNVAHEDDVKTDNIASQLKTALAAAVPSGFTFELLDNIIYITRSDNAQFSLDATDSYGDTHIKGIKGTVGALKDLPAKGKLGFRVRVNGDTTKGQDDYFVELQEPENGSDYVWKECVGFGVKTQLDASTLPHQLVRNANGTFTFGPVSWKNRNAGDDDTNPFPSFANYDESTYANGRYTINDVFFYKDRLCFLSDENLIASQTGEYFNFFQTTVLTLLDDGVVDIAVSNNTVSILKHGVPFDESIILFSDLAQFKVLNADIFSPSTVSASITTAFEASLKSKPASAGKYVFFPTLQGKWSGIREYFVDSDNDTNDAASITAHVPSYLDGEVRQLVASSNTDMLFVLTETDKSEMYIYNYYWSGNEKLQSAWSTWTFTHDILHISVENANLYLLVSRPEGVCLEKINLSEDDLIVDANTFQVNLDRRIKMTSSSTTIPYSTYTLATSKGDILAPTEVQSAINSGLTVVAGVPYSFEYQFSPVVMKNEQNPISTGRLQLKRLNINYSDTGFFGVTVARKNSGQQVNTAEFNSSSTLGTSGLIADGKVIETGDFDVSVQSEASNTDITVNSSSHLPVVLQSAEWEAVFHLRSRRIN